MRTLQLTLVTVCFAAGLAAATNPVPLVNIPLVPESVAPGGAGFTLTVNGTGFVAGSVVSWSGSPRATAFVNGSQVTAAILAADVATAGTASVTVTNPTPAGGTSNVAFFEVAESRTGVAFSQLVTYPIFVQQLTAADLNGDGKLDLVVASEGLPVQPRHGLH